jgi:hypothetical protein
MSELNAAVKIPRGTLNTALVNLRNELTVLEMMSLDKKVVIGHPAHNAELLSHLLYLARKVNNKLNGIIEIIEESDHLLSISINNTMSIDEIMLTIRGDLMKVINGYDEYTGKTAELDKIFEELGELYIYLGEYQRSAIKPEGPDVKSGAGGASTIGGKKSNMKRKSKKNKGKKSKKTKKRRHR